MSEAKSGLDTLALRSESVQRPPSRWVAIGRDGLRDAVAGIVAAVVLIANIVSFGALMFPGEFSAGIPLAVWSMLIGACICGVWIALTTSLPPIATGIDSPTGTVLVLLSALAGSRVVAAGGNPQADPSDTLDLVAVGRLNIEVAGGNGRRLSVRRVMTNTVVGEMGFFRQTTRSASVFSDGAAILFTLTRDNFNRMRRERPDLASAFDDFIVRVLADRVESGNREIAALIP